MLLHIINISESLVTIPIPEGAVKSIRLRRKYDDAVVEVDWTKEQFVAWVNSEEVHRLKNGTSIKPPASIIVFMLVGPVEEALASLVDVARKPSLN